MDAANQGLDVQQAQNGAANDYLGQYNYEGQKALQQLMGGMRSGAFTPNAQNIANDPGYQFRMQQAQQALSRSAASKGMLHSGAFAKSLDQYSQGLASQEYQNAFQRGQAGFNNLYETAGLGANAGTALANVGQHNADSQSSLYGAHGNAASAGAMGMFNSMSTFGNDGMSQMMGGMGGGGGGGFGGMMGGYGFGGGGGGPSQGGFNYMPSGGFGGTAGMGGVGG